MKTLFNSLYARLALVFLLLLTLLGAWLLYLTQELGGQYSQEVMQRLNSSVAMYVTDQDQLIDQGQVNEPAIDSLAERAMILNPSLEIYLLDPDGKILSHRLPSDSVFLNSVSLEPVGDYLNDVRPMPILGDDPRRPEQPNSISVSPVMQNGELQGYVYVIVGGQLYQQLQASVMDSYVIRIGLLLVIASIVAAFLLGSVLFFFLTRRLSALQRRVSHLDLSKPELVAELAGENQKLDGSGNMDIQSNGDEVDSLDQAIRKMARHIYQQFDAMRSLDETRRELIANVSHDLRTPLASLQGYIETLIIRDDELSEQQRSEYLNVAHKNSKRLTSLVAELFELAKLEAGGIEPNIESFSLLELAHDCVQEFGLRAETKQIDLTIEADESDCFVVADIALIHRVLQNLIDNAFQHTPEGGAVKISLSRVGENTLVAISDTGEGIQTHEIPHIFDRFYQSQHQQPSDKLGTGLGLAIVKRILDLHKTGIDVTSQLSEGTSFIFQLPQSRSITA